MSSSSSSSLLHDLVQLRHVDAAVLLAVLDEQRNRVGGHTLRRTRRRRALTRTFHRILTAPGHPAHTRLGNSRRGSTPSPLARSPGRSRRSRTARCSPGSRLGGRARVIVAGRASCWPRAGSAYHPAPMWWLWIPLIILGAVLVALLVLLVLLGRFRNGALLRPLVARLSRIGFMRRFFTRVSRPRSSGRTPSSRAR